MGIVVRQSFLNLISIGIAFLIGAVNTLYLYPTFLGSKLQGLIIALLAISNLLQPFISFGTQHAVIRYYSKYNKKTDKDGLLTLSIIIPLVIVILFVPIFFTYYDQIRLYLFQSDQSLSKYAYVILFIAVSTSFFEVFYSWLRVKLKSVFGNFLKELYPRLLIAFLLISYSYGILNFENFVLFLIYGYYLRLLIVIIYSFYINKPRISFAFKSDFKEAAQRADKAGFEIIEIHGAHGYLLHSFFSPISNKRNDKYGGSFENRIRFALEIITEIKSVWPKNKPLFYRLSSIDTPGEGATIDDNVKLSKALKLAGIDVVDCSSGGITGSPVLTKSKIIPGFQVPYSEKIKKEADINSMAVGAIISADQANDIIFKNRADLVALGRELLADTQWVYKAAMHFNLEDAKSYLPDSYSFYLSRRDEFLDRSAKPA